MSEKSPDAFRTISEIAEELDLPQHVLRFWETKFSQIRPTKRSSGRRFYRPDDVRLIRTIRDLLYRDGYTIRGVQQLLREHGAKGVVTEPPGTVSLTVRRNDVAQAELEARFDREDDAVPLASPLMPAMGASALESELRGCIALLRSARAAI